MSLTFSLKPNAQTDWMVINGEKKIIIFALTDIQPGEEISYNYMFSADGDKVPCLCGAPNCKGFMNV